MVRQLCPCSPWKLTRPPTLEEVDASGGVCDLVRSVYWSRFPGSTCDIVGDPHWSSLFLKDCTPWKGTSAGIVCEELQPVGRTHSEEVGGGVSPIGGTPHWSRGRV
ncbi:hypothetical protein BTVI_02456 [Pitangus sulphuratus]|nr:hypothetical protein BTVI_02456 [Pitangus sulphuratus]